MMTKPLPTRPLGASGLEVTSIGLGLMSLSGIYGESTDENGVAVIRRAIDLGINFFDSSDMYGWGHNETLLKTALRGVRNKVVLASKFGQTKTDSGANGVDGRPEYVKSACDASLKRLGAEVIDLYYIHRVDPKVAIEETVGAMADLIKQGKVRALGICEASPQTIQRAHQVHPIAAVQTEYSLLYRQQAEETLKTTRELGISFVAYSPLGRSLLTGTVQSVEEVSHDRRKDHPRFHEENFEKNRALVKNIEIMASDKNCTPGQLALAWLLKQGNDIIAIPGTKQLKRVDENLQALSVELTTEEVYTLSTLFPLGVAAGTRYPLGAMKGIFI
jgi:aryl-alcohol dehydrogenase-like predicted oxidoreductase